MKDSEYYEEIKKRVYEYVMDHGGANCSLFQGAAFAQHRDGSTFFFEYASAVEYPGHDGKIPCIVLVTEHNGYHVLGKEDVVRYGNFERSPVLEFDPDMNKIED